jgi:predicted Zn-dependent peptidase
MQFSPLGSGDYHALLVLNQLIGGSPSSRLFLNLRESKGLAYYAFSQLSFFKNNGLFWIRVKSSPPSVGLVVKDVRSQLNSLLEERIDPLELEKAKAYLAGNFPLENQLPEQMAKRISWQFMYQLSPDFWNKYYENLLTVSSEKVQECGPPVQLPGSLYCHQRWVFQACLDIPREIDRLKSITRKGQLIASCEKVVVKMKLVNVFPNF